MSDSNVVYLVPPYLLHTCYGVELQREVFQKIPALGASLAFVPSKSCYFRQPKHLSDNKCTFSENSDLDHLIREKLKEKLAVSGILGLDPPHELADDYLFELYDIFRARLLVDAYPGLELAVLKNDSLHLAPPSPSANPVKVKHSLFEYPHLGEFVFGPETNVEAEKSGTDTIPYKSLDLLSLAELMELARGSEDHKYSFRPYLMVGGEKSFLSPLPMYWTPLSVDKHLEQLDALLGMNISLEDGYSILEFKLNKLDFQFDDLIRRKRYYNFIGNNDISSNNSIFYYEVSVEQMTTQATNYRPLLQANDSSLSSGSTLFFSVGYTKRDVRFDRMPSTSGTASSIQTLDLKDVQSQIAFYNQDVGFKKLDEDTLTFLGAEPGVSFEGSFAVSFNNSCSYASIKNGDGSYRTSSLNMNRRFSQLNRQSVSEQETSRMNIEVPFTTHTKPQSKNNKRFSTDTIGCGVNFINKTLFITLNGILVKTITQQEIVSTNRYKDSIFDLPSGNPSLFPMIGFQLSEIPKEIGPGDLPESKVITNFGQREFMFNINHYAKEFKTEQETELHGVISEELRNLSVSSGLQTKSPEASFELSIRNLKDDLSLLNEFIKGYLIQEGYLDSLNAFQTDLGDLADNTSLKTGDDVSMRDSFGETDADSLVRESDASNRQILRSLILEKKFLEAVEFLQAHYQEQLGQFEKPIFELKVLHYVYLLQKYVDSKLGKRSEVDSDKEETDLLAEAYKFGKVLLSSPDVTAHLKQALGELSSVLLIKSKDDLSELRDAKRLIDNLQRETEGLAEHLNVAILNLKGFAEVCKLESMIHSTRSNVSKLSHDSDDAFKMINFEKDYIDV